jgi:hypothetical protein
MSNVETDVYPLTVEEYESGEVQHGSWNILLDCPDVEVE